MDGLDAEEDGRREKKKVRKRRLFTDTVSRTKVQQVLALWLSVLEVPEICCCQRKELTPVEQLSGLGRAEAEPLAKKRGASWWWLCSYFWVALLQSSRFRLA